MKRSSLIVSSAVVVVLGAVLIVPSLMNWDQYKDQAITQVKKATGLDLAIAGHVGLGLLPTPHVSLEGVTIKAPPGSARETLVSIKDLDIHVALTPLLSGKIAVSSLSLDEPVITIEKLANGQFNYMTPELSAKMDNKQGAPTAGGPADISLSNVAIEKGDFTFIDSQKNATSEIKDFDADVQADTLQGPYELNAKLKYGNYDIAIEGDAGRYNSDSKTIMPKVKATITPGDVKASYTGVVTMGEAFNAQGETILTVKNLAGTLKSLGVKNVAGLDAPIMVKGLVTATPASVEIKDLSGNIGGDEFTGDVSASMNPVNINVNLKTSGNLNADKFLAAGEKDKKDSKVSLDVLPKTLSVPPVNANIALQMGSLTWHGQTFNGVTLAGGKGDKVFPFAMHANDIPGKGAFDMKGTLSYASENVDKTGAHIYSNPSLSMTVDTSTANLPFTLQALSGSKDEIPYSNLWQRAALKTGVVIQNGSIALKDGAASLDDMELNIAGSYTPTGARPKASITVSAGSLDWDALQNKLSAAKNSKDASDQKSFDPSALAQSLKLPFDLSFDVGAQNIKAAGYSAGGVRGKGSLNENSLVLDGLSVNDFANANLSVSGKIADLKSLSGIDVSLDAKAGDVKKLAQTLKVKTDGLPTQLTSAEVQTHLTGTLANMAMTTNVKALNGEVLAQGTLVNPLTKLDFSTLKLQVKHSNMNEAIRIFSPGYNGSPALNKPLDIYTEMNRDGNNYKFSNIKGNLAGSSLQGNLSLNNNGAVPSLAGSFQFGDLVLDNPTPDAVPAASGGAGSSGRPSGEARWSREAIDTSWMSKMDADLDIVAKSITYGNWNLKNPVLKVSLKSGELNVTQLNADMYGGKFAMTGKVRSAGSARQPLYIEGNTQFTHVSVEDLVKGFAGSRLIKGSGDVNLDMKVTSSGISPAALIYDLAGNGTVTGSKIVLDGIDVNRFARALAGNLKPGDSLLNLWKGTTGGGSTSFDTLDGNFTITEGVVNINKMDLDGPRAAIATTGNINLPRWTLSTKHHVTVKDRTDVPAFDISLSGSLDNPGQTFGEGVLQDYFNRKLQSKVGNLISDKVGGKLGGALGQILGGGAAATTTAAPKNTTTPETTAPASGTADTTTAVPVQPPQADPAEEAVKGLLKGLLH